MKQVVIIGAGPAGLMAAEVLSQLGHSVTVVEQKPSAARKFLMAGKTGLNISHNEALPQFIARYDRPDWLRPMLEQCEATWIRQWMQDLGIQSYVGSSGRIFPIEMKAAPLLRAWLKRLQAAGVRFLYRTQCVGIQAHAVRISQPHSAVTNPVLASADASQHVDVLPADAIVLACGAVSWPQLGSDGAWQDWLEAEERRPFMASNVGVQYAWSAYMQSVFGQPLKRVNAWVIAPQATAHMVHGDIIVSQYGLESGVIYQLNRALREQIQHQGQATLVLDLLPDVTLADLTRKLAQPDKHSLNNRWRKLGLDATKIALLRDVIPKDQWSNATQMAQHIKTLNIIIHDFRPIAEAISCAGGIKQEALSPMLQLNSMPSVFCCGEMLDWDAPTGGYLLTACFATGHTAGLGVHQYLTAQR